MLRRAMMIEAAGIKCYKISCLGKTILKYVKLISFHFPILHIKVELSLHNGGYFTLIYETTDAYTVESSFKFTC